MHLFLTGAHGAGKSRIVDQAINAATGSVLGFRTRFGDDREAEIRKLYMVPAVAEFDPQTAVVVARFAGRYNATVIPETFNDYAVRLLGAPDSHAALRVMDECSFLERGATQFTARVLACLDEEIPILGVLTLRPDGWTNAIAAHRKVRILEVTEVNRAEVEQTVFELLNLPKD